MLNFRKFLLATALVTWVAGTSQAASFMPVGPQNDVAVSTVTGTWGWNLIYQGDYADSVPISTLFGGAQTYVMIGGMKKGSGIIDVLAATTLTALQTYTGHSQTHLSNGSEWYYNGYSIGFAGAGDSIVQNQADVKGSAWDGQPERDRLSWHANDSTNRFDHSALPSWIIYGWRSGTNIELNDSHDWERVVFTAQAVPGPIAGSGFAVFVAAGIALTRRRRAGDRTVV